VMCDEGLRIADLGRHRALFSLQLTAGSRQLDKVQSSMFKVPSCLTNLRRNFILETLNLRLCAMPFAVSLAPYASLDSDYWLLDSLIADCGNPLPGKYMFEF
jgi:hypothetical protein